MPKKNDHQPAVAFLNLGLTKELNKRLTTYCLARMNRNGAVKHGLRTKIARQALEQWLDAHEKDFTLEL